MPVPARDMSQFPLPQKANQASRWRDQGTQANGPLTSRTISRTAQTQQFLPHPQQCLPQIPVLFDQSLVDCQQLRRIDLAAALAALAQGTDVGAELLEKGGRRGVLLLAQALLRDAVLFALAERGGRVISRRLRVLRAHGRQEVEKRGGDECLPRRAQGMCVVEKQESCCR